MQITPTRVVAFIASAMTSAAFQAVLALPDRPAAPAAHAATKTKPVAATRAPYCYAPSNRVLVAASTEIADDDYGTAYETPALWVADSPCHDINVRSPYNAAGPALGQPVCVPLKVIVAGSDSVGWVDTCSGWQVLAKATRAGKPFAIRSALRPVEITVAS